MFMLKRYRKFLYTVFFQICALYSKHIKRWFEPSRNILRSQKKLMMHSTKGSILWIILLQSRQFTLEEVDMLCEFTKIYEYLQAKRATILHSQMPSEIIHSSTPAPAPPVKLNHPTSNLTINVDTISKQLRAGNTNSWHPKLWKVLQGPITTE